MFQPTQADVRRFFCAVHAKAQAQQPMEAIETLASLVEQFQLIDEHLQDFCEDYPQQALDTSIENLRSTLGTFANRAKAALAPLHFEQAQARIRPTPPPTPPSPSSRKLPTSPRTAPKTSWSA